MKHMNIASPTASQRAYDYVRTKLEDGLYPPGTRLVTRTLAKQIGSSLNPVREALSRLATQGLINHIPGTGAFVRKPDQQEIEDLYGLREALESHAAELAATRIDAGELSEMAQICDGWQGLADELQQRPGTTLDSNAMIDWVRTEERFHHILVAAARNALLTRACSEYRVLSGIFAKHLEQALPIDATLVAQVARSHSALVESLRAGDGESARRQTAEMIRQGCENLRAHGG